MVDIFGGLSVGRFQSVNEECSQKWKSHDGITLADRLLLQTTDQLTSYLRLSHRYMTSNSISARIAATTSFSKKPSSSLD